jgi:serine/threonine protein kinase
MKPELLCMSCMARRGAALVCPHCGQPDHGPESPQQLAPRTILEHKYIIGRCLGQGGFGITYLAYDLQEEQKLAIKEYFPVQISARSADRLTVNPISGKNRPELQYGLAKFAEEARALSNFRNHPGVVSLHTFFYANSTAYIVMDYVEGEDLKQYLKKRGNKISFDAALKILVPVMTALEDVHRAHIIHRDISPDNIYVETDGGVKILDFGATRQAMGEQSRSLSVILKPGYAPEEQYRGKGRLGPWTDIYALGATFYRSITGKIPPDALDRLAEDDLTPPGTLGVQLPAGAQSALMKALAVRAVDRFQNIAAFRQALLPPKFTPSVLSQEPVKVHPERSTREDSSTIQPVSEVHPRIVRLPKVFLLAAICSLFLVLLVVTGNRESVWGDPAIGSIVEVALLLILFSIMLFIFGRMWRAIQDGKARATPDSAIAYCFIPLFNLYWAFPVFWGFARDYNRFQQRHCQTDERLNETLFLFSSIAYVAGWCLVPVGGWLAQLMILLNASLLLPAVSRVCDAVNGLSETKINRHEKPVSKLFRLHCVGDGEYEGKYLDVSCEGFVIGRSPSHASVVLADGEISSRHVRVWQDAASAGVWIEDLNSTNGTYCRNSHHGDTSSEWNRLTGSKLLLAGDRFRLSQNGAEFEIQSS